MKTGAKIAIGACVAGLAVLLVTRVARAAPKNGFVIKLVNPPEGAALWLMGLDAETFNFSPAAGSGPLKISEAWIYEGLYKGEPEWQITVQVVVTIVDSENELLLQQKSEPATFQNGKSYKYDCVANQLTG